jgi:hypothetical protein
MCCHGALQKQFQKLLMMLMIYGHEKKTVKIEPRIQCNFNVMFLPCMLTAISGFVQGWFILEMGCILRSFFFVCTLVYISLFYHMYM